MNPPGRQTLSACVIARDEEHRLPDCLASLRFCDEVIVVDSGSRDRTRELAAAAGAKVFENPWPGFAIQRNFALDRAAGDWVLEIDADERVSPELAAEIEALLASPPEGVTMAAVPMRDLFLGAQLGPSARYPRYRHRLFRRGAYRHDESRTVHEGLWPAGPVAALDGELRHLLAGSWGEALADTLAYARLESAQRPRPGAGEALTGIFARPLAKLAYRLLLYGGWRDGWRGFVRIGLECAGDSLATVQRLRAGGSEGEHGFGQEAPKLGPPKIVGLAIGRAGADRIVPWLTAAAAAGADVVLLGAGPSAPTTLPRRALAGRGPGALVRGLDAEDQARPIDAVLCAGRRERRALSLAPAALRGVPGAATLAKAPESVAAELRTPLSSPPAA
jgi:hypothetical protein